MHVNVVIVAAGKGTRLQSELPKPFLSVAGRPILVHTLRRFTPIEMVRRIVVVVAAEREALCREVLHTHGPWPQPIAVIHGGAERQDSVRNGLAALETQCEIVVIHDAARPFISVEAIQRSIEAASEAGSAVVAIPVRDTIKRADAQHTIRETVSRHDLWLAQTPQTFQVGVIRAAHQWAQQRGIAGTDDATLVEQMGRPVRIVPGDALNFKITTPDDLALAQAVLQAPTCARPE